VKSLVPTLKIVIPTFFLILFGSFLLIYSAHAGTLTNVYIHMSRIKAGLTGAAGQTVEMILAINPSSNISTGGTIVLEFPDAEDATWCRTEGSLTITATATDPAADLSGTGWQIDSALPGTLTGACTQGSGVGTVDKFTISGVGALTAGTTYGVKIGNNLGVIGTAAAAGEHAITVTASQGTTSDSKSFKIDLLTDDAVVITATVSDMATVDCTISANTVNLGTLFPGGTYATGSHTITTSTTSSGYYWAVYGTGDGSTDAGLWKSTATTHLIQSGTTATLDLTNASITGFGMTLSDPDTAGSAVVTTNFVDTTAGTFGTIDRLFAGAKMVLYQNGNQLSGESSTVTYGAKASAAAPAGTYQETVYFVCGGYY